MSCRLPRLLPSEARLLVRESPRCLRQEATKAVAMRRGSEIPCSRVSTKTDLLRINQSTDVMKAVTLLFQALHRIFLTVSVVALPRRSPSSRRMMSLTIRVRNMPGTRMTKMTTMSLSLTSMTESFTGPPMVTLLRRPWLFGDGRKYLPGPRRESGFFE